MKVIINRDAIIGEGGGSEEQTITMTTINGIVQIPMGMVFQIGSRKFVGTADNRGRNFAITELK